MKRKYRLSEYCLKVLLPIHTAAVVGLFLYWNQFTSNHLFVFFFFWFLFGGLGIEVASHRLFSHRAFSCSGKMRSILGLLSCYGGQWSPLWWAALHRGVHHSKSDREGDVHSPIDGLWHSYLGWYFTNDASKVSFGCVRDLLKDRFQQWLHKRYVYVFWVPILLLAVIDLRIALVVFVFPALASIHQENLINSICHVPTLGYRRHPTVDRSTNNIWLGLFIWGAGFHNNHHNNPQKYDFGEAWFEVDICRFVVPAIKYLDVKMFGFPSADFLDADVPSAVKVP